MGATTEPASGARVRGTIRYWAAAKSEAGLAEEPYEAQTLAEALAAAKERHAARPKLVQLLGHCSYLVDGAQVGGRDHTTVALTQGGTVEVLPPFAGG